MYISRSIYLSIYMSRYLDTIHVSLCVYIHIHVQQQTRCTQAAPVWCDTGWVSLKSRVGVLEVHGCVEDVSRG